VSESETRGTTAPAGAGVDDEEMAAEVEQQTSSDLEAEPAFEREAGGVDAPDEAAKGGTA
jgi:hypothetical protein